MEGVGLINIKKFFWATVDSRWTMVHGKIALIGNITRSPPSHGNVRLAKEGVGGG
jgi:hypothetical protein